MFPKQVVTCCPTILCHYNNPQKGKLSRFGSYHPFVILLVNAHSRLLDDNVGDFREIGKIVP